MIDGQIVRMLVDVGATAASAAHAATILTGGGSVQDAFDVIELADEPAAPSLEAALLVSLAVTTVKNRDRAEVARR